MNVQRWPNRFVNPSSSLAVRDRSPGRENMNLLFDSDIVNLQLKNNGGEIGGLILFYFFYFCRLECFNCQRLGCGSLGQRVLFRTS